MKISEIFFSIQGESTYAGLPCAVIRLAGCDLRCSYCDTAYAWEGGEEKSIPEILETVETYSTKLALVTGGEPMLQQSVHELLRQLLARDYTVLLETGGHILLSEVDPRVHKIVDFKCPSSGMMSHNDYRNVDFLTRDDEVKFVIGERRDFDWACEIVRRYHLCMRAGAILFSPVYGKMAYADLAEWILSCGLPVRLQLQLHKIIWPEIERGV